MKKLLFLLTLVGILGMQKLSLAITPFSGNGLLDVCNNNKTNCLYYIEGVFDSALLFEEWANKCVVSSLPSQITVNQLMDLVLKTIQELPEKRHEPAVLFVLSTIKYYFPCGKK